jgi:hypothetical protein
LVQLTSNREVPESRIFRRDDWEVFRAIGCAKCLDLFGF